MILWARIRSWHALDTSFTGRTLCGRVSSTHSVDVLPPGKSCETCLRIVAKKADA